MTRRRALLLAVAMAAGLPGAVAGTGPGADIEGRVRASPIQVVLNLADDSIQVGQSVKAEARVTNIGTVTLPGLTIELRGDRVGLSFKTAIVSVGQLKPGKSATVSWSVCGRIAGSYVVLARATEAGQPVDSIARLLTVRAGGRKTCS